MPQSTIKPVSQFDNDRWSTYDDFEDYFYLPDDEMEYNIIQWEENHDQEEEEDWDREDAPVEPEEEEDWDAEMEQTKVKQAADQTQPNEEEKSTKS